MSDKQTIRAFHGVVGPGMLILISALSIAAPPPGATHRLPDTLYQTDGFGTTSLDFIPESVLNEAFKNHFASLALPANSLPLIDQSIRFSRSRQAAGKFTCTLGTMGALPAGEGEPLAEGIDALKASRLVIVGNVESLVSGITASADAATLVKVRVTQILKDDLTTHVGDLVTLLERIGRTTVDGIVICTANSDYRLPHVGEEVVVGGDADPDNAMNLISAEHKVFFVMDGTISKGGRKPENWQPISVTDLERELNPGRSR